MSTSRRALLALIGVAASLALAGCGPDAAKTPAPSATASVPRGSTTPAEPASPRVIAEGLDAPWSIAFLGDTALISARDTGEILELTGAGARVVGTIDDVTAFGESGLLGVAVDDRDRLYVYSTAADGNRIQRYAIDGDPGSLRLGGGETIVDRLPSASVHSGGRIAFGPDGMLYATVGDAGDRAAAQDLESLAGKILRMTPDGDVPDDNPFGGSLVYSFGHRNPQGIAWADDGTMFASEFGQDTWDELNVIEAGANYGWPEVEGIGGDERFVDPVQQWAPSEASPSGIAIAGGTVYIANLRGAVLRTVPVADPSTSSELFAGEYGRLRDVAVAPSGELWILTNNTDGRGTPTEGDDRILAIEPR
ncbi:PQQ-dependent sugar dehydrogenase [Microbacterium sp. MEC084]|uniref:PQQ-dependent sugar dehydrogenase n=1 Tax=Microbacterium sp. MEC084 TaxID=1963027 RepID=UPI0010705A72|nr:PQQ-dependent sugar dehydrogenase [Microbacterium sp. MEC084]MCD1268789.1 PQQ-dependent sugar dehydrogenase [Microbacterium sp. MEC084]